MRHEDAVVRLPELVGLRAATDEDPELDAHVATCARCQERLSRLRQVDSGLRALDEPPPVSARLERRVLAIPAGGGETARGRSGRRRHVALAAAAIALAAVIALAVVLARDGSAPAGEFRAERVVRLGVPRAAAAAEIEIGHAEGNVVPMRLIATGLPHGGGRYYGVWLTGPGGRCRAAPSCPTARGAAS